MEQPLVSVILTSYNQPELLERAFNSVLQQTYKNIEIIITDDCSTDEGNKKLIEKLKTLYPQKVKAFYQEKNVGIPKNKNTGFRMAAGEYITYLDGDDTYYERKIDTEIKTFLQNPDVGVVYSNFDIKDMDGRILTVWAKDFSPAQGYIFNDVILNNFPDCHTHRYELFKRQVFYELDFYNELFSVYHDLDFMLRYSLKFKVAYNKNLGSSYYKNPCSIVSKTKRLKLIEQQEQVYSQYIGELKKKGIEKSFNRYLKSLQLNKLFYLEHSNYFELFQHFLKKPTKLFTLLKIANYLHKTKKSITN